MFFRSEYDFLSNFYPYKVVDKNGTIEVITVTKVSVVEFMMMLVNESKTIYTKSKGGGLEPDDGPELIEFYKITESGNHQLVGKMTVENNRCEVVERDYL